MCRYVFNVFSFLDMYVCMYVCMYKYVLYLSTFDTIRVSDSSVMYNTFIYFLPMCAWCLSCDDVEKKMPEKSRT